MVSGAGHDAMALAEVAKVCVMQWLWWETFFHAKRYHNDDDVDGNDDSARLLLVNFKCQLLGLPNISPPCFNDLLQMGMMFVRCRGGVSHSPLEHVEPLDIAAATSALYHYIMARADTAWICHFYLE
jgi:hypothetical protein